MTSPSESQAPRLYSVPARDTEGLLRTSTGGEVVVRSDEIDGELYIALEYGSEIHELIDFDAENAGKLINEVFDILARHSESAGHVNGMITG